MRDNKILLLVIFIISTVTAILLYNSYQHIRITFDHSKEAILLQQYKRELLTQMYDASRERTLILLNMLNEKDVFELDDLNQQMSEEAGKFIKARLAFTALSLSKKESELINQQNKIISKNAPLQNRVAKLFMEGESELASAIFFKEALPGQNNVLTYLDNFIAEDSVRSNQTIEGLAEGVESAGQNFILLSGVMIITNLFIVLIVINRSSFKERKQLLASIKEREQHSIKLGKAKDLADAANKAKSVFLSTMSHEIRTPMNGVMGMAQLLENTPLNNQQKEYLSSIIRSGNSLLTIINDILDFSKLDANMVEIENIEFDLEQVCLESIELVAGGATDKELEFILDYQPNCARVYLGDPSRLRQILVNLLGNSAKFTKEGFVRLGVSCLSAENESDLLRIEVQDTGVGLKNDENKKLFSEFSQADSSTTRTYGGTGLGLAISKRITELMGGDIDVVSIYGEGSTFWINIRLEKVKLSQKLNHGELNGVRILLVDNIIAIRKNQFNLLKYMGADPTVIQSSAEVTHLLQEAVDDGNPYKILILSHNMKEKSSLELGLEIRKNHLFDSVKILALSSVGQGGEVDAYSQAGFTAFLNKLCRHETLYSVLSGMLQPIAGTPIITEYSIKAINESNERESVQFEGNILLVEDIITNQIVAESFLKEFGLTVSIAVNGEQAVKEHKNNHYDLIFMDCHMPVMNGYEATKNIRNLESKKKDVVIIALTANASTDDRKLCEAAGMNDVVIKPFTRADLIECLQQWLPKPESS